MMVKLLLSFLCYYDLGDKQFRFQQAFEILHFRILTSFEKLFLCDYHFSNLERHPVSKFEMQLSYSVVKVSLLEMSCNI